jgi:hypothetical protein
MAVRAIYPVRSGGFHWLTFKVLTHVTEGIGGGLLNAIEGTAVLAFEMNALEDPQRMRLLNRASEPVEDIEPGKEKAAEYMQGHIEAR